MILRDQIILRMAASSIALSPKEGGTIWERKLSQIADEVRDAKIGFDYYRNDHEVIKCNAWLTMYDESIAG